MSIGVGTTALKCLMQISKSEFDKFAREAGIKRKTGGEWHGLRYGQAWYNYFNLQKRNPGFVEGRLMDQIYNERDDAKAKSMILKYFTSAEN